MKTGLALWLQQFIALLIKRFHHARRGKKSFISQILLPAFFVAAAMAFSLLRPPRGVLPPLKLTPSQFGDPNYVFIANLRKNFSLSKQIVDAAVKVPGLGKVYILSFIIKFQLVLFPSQALFIDQVDSNSQQMFVLTQRFIPQVSFRICI